MKNKILLFNRKDLPIVNSTGEEWTYTLSNNYAHIKKYKGSETEVTIPDYIDGYETRYTSTSRGIFSSSDKVVYANIGHNLKNSMTTMVDLFLLSKGLVSVDKHIVGRNVTNMYGAFAGCYNLVNSPIIPNSVEFMISTFELCTNLVDSPIIPNSVVNMAYTFAGCANLTNIPESLPNSVVDMRYTYIDCTNITKAPTIPDSVVEASYTFSGCTKLTGDIYIYSNEIANATRCFHGTSLPKTVHIYEYYENGEHTKTYNSFNTAGYLGGINGVTVEFMNE